MHGFWIFVDDDTSEVVLSESRTLIKPRFLEEVGNRLLFRFAVNDHKYIRHSNYILRTDPQTSSDRPWMEDTEWMLSSVNNVDLPTAPPTPSEATNESAIQQFHRPLFIHVTECWEDVLMREDSLRVLFDFIEGHVSYSLDGRRITEDTQKVISYPLQGAGGIGMTYREASAISMERPGRPVDENLKKRIEAATTVSSRGGLKSFLRPSHLVADLIKNLSRLALSEMRRKRMFGLVKNRSFDLELGFCEWVTLPEGGEISPHRDGGNDCDVAAIVGVHNKAFCTVENTQILLDEGEMYIFEPQKYTHSVGVPLLPGNRHVLALRFFRV